MIKQLVTINFLQWLGDFSPADWSRAIVDDCTDHWKLLSLCLVTLFESSGCETESPRVAEFRLVSSCRKENKWYRIKHSRTREQWGYDWRLPSLLVSTSCTSTIYTESLRPSQIHSQYKRIIPSRLFLKYPSSHYSIYIKLLIQIFLLSLRQGVPQWWYRSLKLFFILNLQTNSSTFYAHHVTPYTCTLNELFHSALTWEYNVYVPQLRWSNCVVTNTSITS